MRERHVQHTPELDVDYDRDAKPRNVVMPTVETPPGGLRCPSRVVLSGGEDALGDYPIWRLTADQAVEAGALLAHVFVDDPLFVAVDTK